MVCFWLAISSICCWFSFGLILIHVLYFEKQWNFYASNTQNTKPASNKARSTIQFLPLFLKSCSNNIHTPLRSLCQRCPWLSSKQIWCQTVINTTNSAQGFDKRCIFSFNTTLSFRASEDVSICSKKIHQTSTARLTNLCLPRDMFALPHLLKLFCANLSKSEFLCSPVPCVNKSICKPVHLYVREEKHVSINCV